MQCSACGKEIEEGKRFCRFCGTEMVPSEAAAAVASPGAPPGEAPVVEQPSFVAPPLPAPHWEQSPPPPPGYGQQPVYPPPHGSEWHSPPPGWQQQPPRPSRTPWILVGILIFMLVAGGAAAGVYFLSKDGDGETTTTAATVSSTTSVSVTTTVPQSTLTTLPPLSTTSLTAGSNGEEYVYALGNLDSVLVYADTRIPELAERINQTAPSVPQTVHDELFSLMDSVQEAVDDLNSYDVLAGYEEADSWLQDAAVYMLYRIDSTTLGIEAMWSAGTVSAGTPYFDDGRQARDDFRAAYNEYVYALPGD